MLIGFKQIGSGPSKILALPGWFSDETLLDTLAPSLSTDRFTYVCVAYRGTGKSKALQGRYTIDEMATDVLAVADHFGWDEFSLVGHSMGAKASQMIIARAPKRVRGLVAVTPVPASAVPFDEERWKLFSNAATDVSKRAAIIDFSTGRRLTRTWIDRMAQRAFETSDPQVFHSYLLAWARTDFSSAVHGLPTRALAIVGEHDPHLTLDVIKQTFLSSFPNATAEVMRNCGHYPTEEAPVALATTMERFLSSL
jgi:pimeloyl-ACP methyl ester carboxylesterase